MGRVRVQSILFGLVVLALGLIWLLRNLGVFVVDIGDLIATFWPVIFIIWGLDVLVSAVSPSAHSGHRSSHGLFSASGVCALILIVLGVAIIGRNLGLYYFDFALIWRVLWPLLIILVGWSLIRGSSGAGGTHWAVMSGIERKTPGWNLESGNYLAIMGAADLDLTAANIPPGTTTLNLTAIMGGIDVRVPAGLALECQGTAILGAVQFLNEEGGGIVASRTFSRQGADGDARKLVVRAWTLMGGVEIKGA